VAFIKVVTMYQMYQTWIHPSIILLSHPLIPRIVSTGLIFLFTYMCTQILYYIHPPVLFSHFLSLPTSTNPPGRTCSALLFSDF
jgi:hypothetical protein